MVSMQIAAVGSGQKDFVPRQELPQESRQAQRQRELKAAARANVESSLPGNRIPGERGSSGDGRAVTAALGNVSGAFSKKLRFIVDHESQEITVNVINGDTGEVIKTLPPEELRRKHRRIEGANGFLFDEKI